MKQHGKKSAAAIAAMMVVDGGFGTAVEPPEGMPERQAKIWRDTVKGEPVEFFRRAATKDMLADYCNQRAVAGEMAELINEFKPEWLTEAKGMRRYGLQGCDGSGAAAKADQSITLATIDGRNGWSGGRRRGYGRISVDAGGQAQRLKLLDSTAGIWSQASVRLRV
jgi:hypothetical protein